MPLTPLPPGTRVGPESEPRHFRLARPRRLGDALIEYDAQDTINGHACVVLEFAPRAFCTRGSDGTIVPNADSATTWSRALEEFMGQSTAMGLVRHPHVEELGGLWRGGGTAFRAVKAAQNSAAIPYTSDIIPGARSRRSARDLSNPLAATPAARSSSLPRPVDDGAPARQTAGSTRPAAAKEPSLSSSAAMSSMQNELQALVSKKNSDGGQSAAETSSTGDRPGRRAPTRPVRSGGDRLRQSLESPRGRVAILAVIGLVLIVSLKVCVGG